MTNVEQEIVTYYNDYPRDPSDDELKARKTTRAVYVKTARKERRARWSSKRGASAYRQVAQNRSTIGPIIRAQMMAPAAASPPPGATASFAITPTAGKALAGLLFVEIFAIGGVLRLFILEQLTLPNFLRRGVMKALMDAMRKVALSITGVDDATGVDLIVRKSAAQQKAALAFDDLYGFAFK